MPTSKDRVSALENMSVPDLAALLDRVPLLAQGMYGKGRLAGEMVGLPTQPIDLSRTLGPVTGTLIQLASTLASPGGIRAALDSLTLIEKQIVAFTTVHGGAITREALVAETGDHRELDAAAASLSGLLLAFPLDSQDSWLVLRPGVSRHVDTPGWLVSRALDDASPNDLEVLLDLFDAPEIPSTPTELRAEVSKQLLNPEVVNRLVDRLNQDERKILDVIVKHGVQTVSDLGLSPFNPNSKEKGPLHRLASHCLIGMNVPRQTVAPWLEVQTSLTGRVFNEWSFTAPNVVFEPIHDHGSPLTAVLQRFTLIAERWRRSPVKRLASGGVGVRPIQATAKALGVTPTEAGILVHIAITAGFIGATSDGHYAPTTNAKTLASDPAKTWTTLVQGWIRNIYLDEPSGAITRWIPEPKSWEVLDRRHRFIEFMIDLEPGVGLSHAHLAQLYAFHCPTRFDAEPDLSATNEEELDVYLHCLRLLGLVPSTGPIGLTSVARQIFDDQLSTVHSSINQTSDDIVVQADFTVIATRALSALASERLTRVAVLEQDGAAQIWRIDGDRITSSVADGYPIKTLRDDLSSMSSAPLPNGVETLFRDVESRHGRVRVGTIGSYLRAEDPVDLIAAVAVRDAKLRILAPTVAVSPLTREALVTTLHAKGILAVAEGADGTTLPPREAIGEVLPKRGFGTTWFRTIDTYQTAVSLKGGS